MCIGKLDKDESFCEHISIDFTHPEYICLLSLVTKVIDYFAYDEDKQSCDLYNLALRVVGKIADSGIYKDKE